MTEQFVDLKLKSNQSEEIKIERKTNDEDDKFESLKIK